MLGGGVGWFFYARSRRSRWDERLGVERGQADWVLGQLLPAVTDPHGAAATQSGQWNGAEATLVQLAEGLGALTTSAPDEARRATATALAESLGDVRTAVAADLALRTGTSAVPADAASLATSAASVQAARDRAAAAVAKATPAP